ncbi:MAG: hypothetical protein H3C47_01000 [Candidatus Cloacimonetes bacterium]|nr:hypothetical protein [Candidatus Cloacimonadota bacterium]
MLFDGYQRVQNALKHWPELMQLPLFLCSSELIRVTQFRESSVLKKLSLKFAGPPQRIKEALGLSSIELRRSGQMECEASIRGLKLHIEIYDSLAMLAEQIRLSPILFQRLALSLETGVLLGDSFSESEFLDKVALGQVVAPINNLSELQALIEWCLKYKLRPSQLISNPGFILTLDLSAFFALPMSEWIRDEPFFAWILSDLLELQVYTPDLALWVKPLIRAMAWWEQNLNDSSNILKNAITISNRKIVLPEMGVLKLLFCYSFCDLDPAYLDEEVLSFFLKKRPWMTILKKRPLNEDQIPEIYAALVRDFSSLAPVCLWLFSLRGMLSEPKLSQATQTALSKTLEFAILQQNAFDEFVAEDKSKLSESQYYLALSAWLEGEIRTRSHWKDFLELGGNNV